ncbi:MAG: phytanoyl-CoA dioxygenase family protein [Candidatus Obscuribacterales bacterium]|nr:phytanoyl-CoA dioxygenase family protein [Cyanobacteria bacterium SZAS LIN-5]RTL41403.1 MAG: phytanoyl-CoA dioxygenase [Candidatus Melainabacteria bacterium]
MSQECLIDMTKTFTDEGYSLRKGVLNASQVDQILAAIEHAKVSATVRKRGAGVFAMRHLLKEVPEVCQIAESATILNMVKEILGPTAFPVRAVLLDNDPDAAWYLNWHQDLHIGVKKRVDAPGFSAWSVKNGILHVQPPVEYLSRMLTVRIHLDDCQPQDGALEVIPSSHYTGVLSKKRIDDMDAKGSYQVCAARSGDVLLMRPLLVHRSSTARDEGHRRIVHIEYTSRMLPDGLEWAIA